MTIFKRDFNAILFTFDKLKHNFQDVGESKIKIPTVDGSLGTITSGASPPWLAEWLQLVWRIAGVHMQRRLIDSTLHELYE